MRTGKQGNVNYRNEHERSAVSFGEDVDRHGIADARRPGTGLSVPVFPVLPMGRNAGMKPSAANAVIRHGGPEAVTTSRDRYDRRSWKAVASCV